MKKLLIIVAVLFLTSCADSKEFEVDGQTIYAEPYGWADYHTLKNPNVIYRVNIGNIIWNVVLFETIGVPIWLTGWQFYEPDQLKKCAPNCEENY